METDQGYRRTVINKVPGPIICIVQINVNPYNLPGTILLGLISAIVYQVPDFSSLNFKPVISTITRLVKFVFSLSFFYVFFFSFSSPESLHFDKTWKTDSWHAICQNCLKCLGKLFSSILNQFA